MNVVEVKRGEAARRDESATLCGCCGCSRKRRSLSRLRRRLFDRERDDLLRLVVVKKSEIFGAEISDGAATRITDDDRHENEIDAHAQNRAGSLGAIG